MSMAAPQLGPLFNAQNGVFMKSWNQLSVASTLFAALVLGGCASQPAADSASSEAAAKQNADTAAAAAAKAEPAPAPVVPQAEAKFASAKPNKFVQQTYSTANEGGSNFSLQFLKGNKLVYKTTDDTGKAVQYRGTWKRTGNQIDVAAKAADSDEAVNFAYEVRPELNSTDDKYKECKKFAPGLYPLNINGGTDEDLTYSLWPEHLVKTSAAPCEPERKAKGKAAKRKHK